MIRRRSGSLVFAAVAVVYIAVFGSSLTPHALAHPTLIGTAGLFDLVVTVPFLYWALAILQRRGSWPTALFLSLAGARAASFMLPAGDQFVPTGKWIAAPLELWVLSEVFRRARRVRGQGDVVRSIREACAAIFRQPRLAGIVATELAILYYAFCSWRAAPESRPGYRAYSYAEASGWTLLPLVLGAGLVFEGIPLHLVVQKWNHLAAWILTGFDVYALIWVVALWRSATLRPIFVGSNTVVLRSGLWWEVEVPRASITACRPYPAGYGRKRQRYVSVTVINAPQWELHLSGEIEIRSPYGKTKKTSVIGVAVDSAAEFFSEMR